MKPKILIYFSTLLIATLVLTQCDRRPLRSSHRNTLTAGPVSDNSVKSEEIHDKSTARPPLPEEQKGASSQTDQKNDIAIKKRTEDLLIPSETHPEPWLGSWNPNGTTVGDLKGMFGPPVLETEEKITFGWSGLTFAFKIKEGKAISLKRRLEEVPLRIGNMIQIRSGESANKARPHMEAWVSFWDPIGCNVGDLERALGKPSIETGEAVIYNFDGGFGGCAFEFKLKNGKVFKIERGSID